MTRPASLAARHGRVAAGLHAFVVFGIKQAWACLFGGLMVALLVGTHFFRGQARRVVPAEHLSYVIVTLVNPPRRVSGA